MAIIPANLGGPLERRVGLKSAAKKSAKHPAKKHAAKHAEKHSAKHAEKHSAKHAEKHAAKKNDSDRLGKAFHHLQRASAVVSLLQPESGGDLRKLLDQAIRTYRTASAPGGKKHLAHTAWGLARAAEHLGLAGLYLARRGPQLDVSPAGTKETAKRAEKIEARLAELHQPTEPTAQWLTGMAEGLLQTATSTTDDPHLAFELVLAADGLSEALHEGI